MAKGRERSISISAPMPAALSMPLVEATVSLDRVRPSFEDSVFFLCNSSTHASHSIRIQAPNARSLARSLARTHARTLARTLARTHVRSSSCLLKRRRKRKRRRRRRRRRKRRRRRRKRRRKRKRRRSTHIDCPDEIAKSIFVGVILLFRHTPISARLRYVLATCLVLCVGVHMCTRGQKMHMICTGEGHRVKRFAGRINVFKRLARIPHCLKTLCQPLVFPEGVDVYFSLQPHATVPHHLSTNHGLKHKRVHACMRTFDAIDRIECTHACVERRRREPVHGACGLMNQRT